MTMMSMTREKWNTRPIEDALRERCAELEARLDLYTGNMYDLVVSENERLRAELEECHVLIDKVLDNRSEGMCTGDSSLSHRLSELVSYYQSMNAELAQLKEADRWIHVSERLPIERVPVLIITDYGGMDICFYNSGLWVNSMRMQHSDGGVTNWRPLPPAPDAEAK